MIFTSFSLISNRWNGTRKETFLPLKTEMFSVYENPLFSVLTLRKCYKVKNRDFTELFFEKKIRLILERKYPAGPRARA